MPRRLVAAFALLLLAAAPVTATALGAPVTGATLQDLVAALNLVPLHGAVPAPLALERLADGQTVALPALRGRPVLVYFWATW
jgi:cytochrome oxidase Cu insertion factor (SCO1/SenC/PrrC family)